MNFEVGRNDVILSWKEGKYFAKKLYLAVKEESDSGKVAKNADDFLDWIRAIQELQDEYYNNIGFLLANVETNFSPLMQFQEFLEKFNSQKD